MNFSARAGALFDEAVEHLTAGRYQQAIAASEQVVKHNPQDGEAQSLLGAAYLGMGRYADARRASEKAQRLRPKDPRPRHQIAASYLREGRFADLDRTLDRGFRDCGPDPLLIALKAERLQTTADYEGAFQACRPLLEAGTEHVGVLVAAAKACAFTGRHEEAIAVLRRRLAGPAMVPTARCALLYALGELLDAVGRYDEAFRAMKQANDAKSAAPDPAEQSRAIDRYIAAWSREAIAGLPRGVKTELPVFIVGFFRSGTTLIEQTLSAHPQVFGAGELVDLMAFALERHDRSLPCGEPLICDLAGLTQSVIDRASRAYLARHSRLAPRAARITDKMPANFVHLGLISALFPGARVIHCRRDPVDTCVSCYFNLQGDISYAHDLRALGSFYRDYQRLMAHWKAVLDLPMLEVAYEEVVRDQEAQARRIVEFLGLPWNEACLRPHENKRVALTRSIDQVRKPVYGSSVARWKRYEKHLGPLLEAVGDSVPGR